MNPRARRKIPSTLITTSLSQKKKLLTAKYVSSIPGFRTRVMRRTSLLISLSLSSSSASIETRARDFHPQSKNEIYQRLAEKTRARRRRLKKESISCETRTRRQSYRQIAITRRRAHIRMCKCARGAGERVYNTLMRRNSKVLRRKREECVSVLRRGDVWLPNDDGDGGEEDWLPAAVIGAYLGGVYSRYNELWTGKFIAYRDVRFCLQYNWPRVELRLVIFFGSGVLQ